MRTERIDLLKDYIVKHKSVSLDTLCREFSVSKNTIRRDIQVLAEKGFIKKVYGGVTACESTSSAPALIPYQEREIRYPAQKDAICCMAAEAVQDGDIIYIDTGTTCLNLIDYIAHKECTILTNSLQLAWKAVSYPNLTVISMPGRLKRETLSYVGMEISEFLHAFNITKAFMACTGVTVKNGLTNASMEEYMVKKSVLEHSRQCVLLADHSKFGRVSMITYWPLEGVDHVITDRPLGEDVQEFCRENQIAVSVSEAVSGNEADISSDKITF